HSVAVVAIAWTLARLEIGCVAVEVPIPTGDAIERKPGMAIEQAIMPNVPIIGENLRLDRIIADADELICIDVYVGVHRRRLPGRRGFRLHPNAVIRVHDTITPYHALAGDALRRNKAAVEIAQQAVG